MNVNVASTRGRAGFHNTSAGILHIASVLALQHVSCCCPPGFLDSLLHPLLHFTFVPAAAAPQFDGFREMTFTDQLVKPFVSHTGETGDIVHVDQGIIGTQKYAVVACCSQHGQNVPCEIYEDCANAGNLLSCAFRTGLLRDTRDYRRGNGLPDHTHLDDRGQNH